MNKVFTIAKREFFSRLKSRNFLLFAFFGPLLVLTAFVLYINSSGNTKSTWNVIISDPLNIMDHKIMASESKEINYSFYQNYIQVESFITDKKFQEFDILLEINEEIYKNKTAYLFYKTKPKEQTTALIKYQFERRLEEVLINQEKLIDLEKFRSLKQPINIGIRDAFNPLNQNQNENAWVGFVFAMLCLVFVMFFGMNVMRSVAKDKSNRVVEIILANTSAKSFLFGKIIGILGVALIQFIWWILILSIGLYFVRMYIFPDYLNPTNFQEINDGLGNLTSVLNNTQNDLLDLVFNRINFTLILSVFLLFLCTSFVLFSLIFSILGAIGGSENDGQQYQFLFLLCCSAIVYFSYLTILQTNDDFITFLSYFPFTSPFIFLIKLAIGSSPNLLFSLAFVIVIQILSIYILQIVAGRIFKNSLLAFGHRVSLKHIVKWLKSE